MKQSFELDGVEAPAAPVEVERRPEIPTEVHVILEHDRVLGAARQKGSPGLAVAENQRRFGLGQRRSWVAPRRAALAEASPVDGVHENPLDGGASEFGLHPGSALGAAREIDDVDRDHDHPKRLRSGATISPCANV